MRHIYRWLTVLLLFVGLGMTGNSVQAQSTQNMVKHGPDDVPEDSVETKRHWNKARRYKEQMRLEMARQEFLLALATSRTEATIQHIQRELQIVELQIRSKR